MNGKKAKRLRKLCKANHDITRIPEPKLWQIAVMKINNLLRGMVFLKPLSLSYQKKRSFKSFFRATKRANRKGN